MCYLKGNHILTASWVQSDALQLWDYRTNSLLQTLPLRLVRDNKSDDHAAGGDSGEQASNGAYLYCAQFCTGDVVIAGGSGTKSVQAIDRQSGQVGSTSIHSSIQAKHVSYANSGFFRM